MHKPRFLLWIGLIGLLLVQNGCTLAEAKTSTTPAPASQAKAFDGTRAWKDVETQVNFGPRIPGTVGHQRTIAWIQSELTAAQWTASIQESSEMGHQVRNVLAKRGSGPPQIILGAHFDTRQVADQDPDPANRHLPVPGANDGGSGVAVLLEIARSLPTDLKTTVWLVFFDTEDQGSLPGWDWILGSSAYTKALNENPAAVVVVDMIGDADLNIYQERTSNPALVKSIWQIASSLGYAQFIAQPKYSMTDDHTPFLQKGIPAVDLIDFDYPYWHTISDTPDKVSVTSLKAVGDVLMRWILSPEQLAK